MLNKKGGQKVLFVYWFAIFIIITGGVLYMASVFYGAPYNVRKIESQALLERTVDCISEKGYIHEDFLNKKITNENILEFCHFNFEIPSSEKNPAGQYYLKVEFFKFDSSKDLAMGEKVLSLNAGNPNLDAPREILKENYIPPKFVYLLDKQGNAYVTKISSIVGKFNENVK